jgi:hypothetical protein
MRSWMLSRKARLRVFAGFEAVDEPALPRGQVGDLVAQLNRGVLTRAPTKNSLQPAANRRPPGANAQGWLRFRDWRWA